MGRDSAAHYGGHVFRAEEGGDEQVKVSRWFYARFNLLILGWQLPRIRRTLHFFTFTPHPTPLRLPLAPIFILHPRRGLPRPHQPLPTRYFRPETRSPEKRRDQPLPHQPPPSPPSPPPRLGIAGIVHRGSRELEVRHPRRPPPPPHAHPQVFGIVRRAARQCPRRRPR